MPWDGLHSLLSGLTEVKMTKIGNITESRLLRLARFLAMRIGEQETGMTHLIERWDNESLAACLLHTEKMTMVRKLDSWSRSATLD